jgi:alkylation response protein AidB-like acyl-CoA dehydrogenase
MDFELTEEQRMVQEMTRAFAEKELAPVASRLDRDGAYPHEQLKTGRNGTHGRIRA